MGNQLGRRVLPPPATPLPVPTPALESSREDTSTGRGFFPHRLCPWQTTAAGILSGTLEKSGEGQSPAGGSSQHHHDSPSITEKGLGCHQPWHHGFIQALMALPMPSSCWGVPGSFPTAQLSGGRGVRSLPSPSIPHQLAKPQEHPQEMTSQRRTGARSWFLLTQHPQPQKSWPVNTHPSGSPDSLARTDTPSQSQISPKILIQRMLLTSRGCSYGPGDVLMDQGAPVWGQDAPQPHGDEKCGSMFFLGPGILPLPPCSTQSLPAFGAEMLGHGAGTAFLPAPPNRMRTFLSQLPIKPVLGWTLGRHPAPRRALPFLFLSAELDWNWVGAEEGSYCHYRTGVAVFGAFAPHPRAPKPPVQLLRPLKIPSLESKAGDEGGEDPGRTEGHTRGRKVPDKGRVGAEEDYEPPCTHQTRARRGGWPWRAAPGAVGPAASSGEGGLAGMKGHRVLCQGRGWRRGPPLWQGCCGREEPALPSTSPSPALICPLNPKGPAAGRGILGVHEDSQHSHLHTPQRGPTPQTPPDQFLTANASPGSGSTLLF